VAQGFADSVLDFAPAVGHRHLPRDHMAQVGQPAAQPLLMRVQHTAQHQFTAHVDNFNIHLPQRRNHEIQKTHEKRSAS